MALPFFGKKQPTSPSLIAKEGPSPSKLPFLIFGVILLTLLVGGGLFVGQRLNLVNIPAPREEQAVQEEAPADFGLQEELERKGYGVLYLGSEDKLGKTLLYGGGGLLGGSGVMFEETKGKSRVDYVVGRLLSWDIRPGKVVAVVETPERQAFVPRLSIETGRDVFDREIILFGIEDLATREVAFLEMPVEDLETAFPAGSAVVGLLPASSGPGLQEEFEVEVFIGRVWGGKKRVQEELGKNLLSAEGLTLRQTVLSRGFLLNSTVESAREAFYSGIGPYSGAGVQPEATYVVGEVTAVTAGEDIILELISPKTGERINPVRILLKPDPRYRRLQTATVVVEEAMSNPGFSKVISFADELGQEYFLNNIIPGDVIAAEPLTEGAVQPWDINKVAVRDREGAWLLRKIIVRKP